MINHNPNFSINATKNFSPPVCPLIAPQRLPHTEGILFRKKSAGFSLIEIMVVIVILGILASFVVPQIAKRPEEARLVKAKQDVLAIQNALELYKLDNGFYPSTDQGLLALVEKPTTSPSPRSWQPYLKRLPMDPWKHEYFYLNPGEHGEIDVYSLGAAGDENGTDVIGNWNAQ